MTIASTPVPLSEAKARLSELARRVRLQHERITLTRNGEAEAVLLSVDDLEGLEMTLEILGDSDAVTRISESLAALGRASPALIWPPSARTWPAPCHRPLTANLPGGMEIRFQRAARRAVSERLPESVAAAVLEFCEAALAVNPHRVGKPLFGPLAGCHGARRGTYRIVYRIEENTRTVYILDIDHRAEIYHRTDRT